jgi:hypothetical protein
MSTAYFKQENRPFGYAPYIVFPIDHGSSMSYHVRGPGSIEQCGWPTRDLAETEAYRLKNAYDTGMVFEEAANA